MTIASYNVYQQLTSARVAGNSNVSGFYQNGTLNNGIGATLSALTVGRLSIDGVPLNQGERVLLFQQTNANENGIYIVNQTGSGISLWLLERAPDFQSSEQLIAGQYLTIDAGDTYIGNMFVLVEPLPTNIGSGSTGFNFINIASSSPAGPYLLKSANLSDVNSKQDSNQNLGFGSGDFIVITDSDFSGGLYTLSNPCPAFINVQISQPNLRILLPPANEVDSFALSQGVIIQNNFNSTDAVLIFNHSNSDEVAFLDVNDAGKIVASDVSTVDGTWFVISYVFTIKGIDSAGSEKVYTGDVHLISDDIDANINYTPTNYTPTAGADFAANSITGNLKGIDQSLSVATDTLQTAYDNGNGQIALSADKTFTVLNNTLLSEVNGVTTPSTGTNTVSNYRVNGWTFTPSIDMSVTSLQYDDALFTSSETRETGIYEKASQTLLTSVFIAQTDPLDGTNTYRTKTLSIPVQLNAGIEYVFATVVPSGQSDHTNTDAVPDANVVISQRAELPSSGSLIPLSYPESFTTVSNFVHVGSFQYESTVTDDSFNVNDPVTSDSVFFEVESTTKGTIPAPKMGTAARGAIATPVAGLTILNSDDSPIRYNVYDGSAWQEVAYISEIPSIPPAFGEMYFQDNATPTVIAAINTPVKVTATYNSGILSGFSQATGTLTYTDVNSRTVLVTCDLTATYPGTSNNTSFYIAQNGVVVAKSKQSSYIGAVTPANEPNPVQCMLSLVQNDTIEIWVENNTNGDDITVTDLNITVITLSGIADASIILAGENYLSLSGDTLTANPVNLATTNVTGKLPFANVQDIASGKVLGRSSAGSGTIEQLNTPFGITVTPFGDLIWDYNYGNVTPGTLVPNANVSSVTQTGAFYFEQTGSVTGAIVNGTIQFTFTSTSTLPSIQVPYPVLPGGLSVNAVNVTGNIKNSTIPTIADGNILGSTANSTYFTVEMITAGISTYVATVYYQYRLV